MKSLLTNAMLLCCSFAVALLAGEVILRMAGYGAGNPYNRLLNNNDEYVGYKMIPGDQEFIDGPDGVYKVDIVSLNVSDDDRGFRDDGRDGPAGSLFFGDSFVWGFGVEIEETVAEQFERISGEDAINLGMTAFTSPAQYYRLFRFYAPRFGAEYAFFGFFIGNDFGDSVTFDRWLLSGKQQSYPEWRTRDIRGLTGTSSINRLRRAAYKHSVLWRTIADRVDFGFSSGATSSDETFQIQTDDLDLVLNSGQVGLALDANSELSRTLVFRALRQIKRTGKAARTRPVVFIIPTKELVYQSYYPDDHELRNAQDARYVTVLEVLEEVGLEYIDLLPVFREAVKNGAEQLYFREDGHWNPAGHALAAAELYRYINANPGP